MIWAVGYVAALWAALKLASFVREIRDTIDELEQIEHYEDPDCVWLWWRT